MAVLRPTVFWLLLATVICYTGADFSPSFYEFLNSTYGKELADRLVRNDLGAYGSFGGGYDRPTERVRVQSVVLVHGLTGTAGSLDVQRQYLLRAGWNASDIYGTTYGNGQKTLLYRDSMKCSYVKQNPAHAILRKRYISNEMVRSLIVAVATYTKRRVDVIGYSMGSPISRKAILGGSCVDTKEQLGPPLTDLIDTFVSVAGVNHGSNLCVLFPATKLCNLVNGLSCNSKYIQDINAKPRYEGRYIFSIYSQQDEIVGYRSSCGDVTASVTGADAEFQRPGNHAQVMANTIDLQANLIGAH